MKDADAKRAIFQKRLAAQQKAFTRGLPARVQDVQAAWRRLFREKWLTPGVVHLHRQLHSLAGSCGTFGLPEVGDAARRAEILLKPMIDLPDKPDPDILASIQESIDQLARGVTNALAEDKDAGTEPMVRPIAKQAPSAEVGAGVKDPPPSKKREATSPPPPSVAQPGVEAPRRILLADSDARLTSELSQQLGCYGYETVVTDSLSAFDSAQKQGPFNSIIMNLVLPDGSGAEAITRLQSTMGERSIPPTIFLSEHGEIVHRLTAIRAGGNAFFQKPINPSVVIDALDDLTLMADEQTPRVLLVDDSPSLVEHLAAVLENTGIKALTVTDPLTVLEPLHAFNPDLILLDLHMPGCSGLELAQVIRQQEKFLGSPIVYLSGETDEDRKLAAMSLGADDFLSKPVRPDHLVQTVWARIRRHRKLRAGMTRDSLTGLLNHTATKERLIDEVARSRRSGAELTFALIDIDHFKKVNDTHGHPAGDLVIKGLARLLRQRLRNSDVIGRLGGEEFGVILPETSSETAMGFLNGMREAFGLIAHPQGDAVFHTTFSCGVATLSNTGGDADELNEKADQALYEAKQSGRNRVTLHQEKA